MKKNIEILPSLINAISKRSEMQKSKITLKEISLRAGITESRLKAFLNGEEDIPEDFVANLSKIFDFKIVSIRSVDQFQFDLDNNDEDEDKIED